MHDVRVNTKIYSSGAYQYAQVCFKMERDSQFYTLSIVIALLLVVATYTGLWVSPAAAPGRIALAFLCFLVVKVASLRGHSWPRRARQAASEGLTLPSALVRRGPGNQTPPRGRGLPTRGHPSLHFRCV